jgi:hypothetical protein
MIQVSSLPLLGHCRHYMRLTGRSVLLNGLRLPEAGAISALSKLAWVPPRSTAQIIGTEPGHRLVFEAEFIMDSLAANKAPDFRICSAYSPAGSGENGLREMAVCTRNSRPGFFDTEFDLISFDHDDGPRLLPGTTRDVPELNSFWLENSKSLGDKLLGDSCTQVQRQVFSLLSLLPPSKRTLENIRPLMEITVGSGKNTVSFAEEAIKLCHRTQALDREFFLHGAGPMRRWVFLADEYGEEGLRDKGRVVSQLTGQVLPPPSTNDLLHLYFNVEPPGPLSGEEWGFSQDFFSQSGQRPLSRRLAAQARIIEYPLPLIDEDLGSLLAHADQEKPRGLTAVTFMVHEVWPFLLSAFTVRDAVARMANLRFRDFFGGLN